MKRIPGKILFCGLLFFCLALRGAEDLKSWLDDPELWQKEAEQLQKKFAKNLAWRDGTKQELYCPAKELKNFSYGDYPVYDLVLKFKENRLDSFSFAVFSRGDFKMPPAPAEKTEEKEKKKKKKKKADPAKEAKKKKAALKEQQKLIEKQFKTIISAVKAENKERFKANPQQKLSRLSDSRKTELIWKNDAMCISFSIGTGKDNTQEYLSFRISAPPAAAKPEIPAETPENQPPPPPKTAITLPPKKITQEELRSRVKNENGEHSLDLPMVDQGSKGYCAPATILRVLHYYGISMELHELAKLLNADPVKGTAIPTMIKRLQQIDGRLGIHYHSLYQANFLKPKFAEQFMDHYNQRARRADMPPMGGWSAPKFFYPIYHEMRANRGQWETFFREVRQAIDNGLPLLWSVYCFKPEAMSLENCKAAEEKEPPEIPEKTEKKGKKSKKERKPSKIKQIPAAEGHLRIITGYQENPRAVIYSDSWGKGAERKTMELDEAWTITTLLFLLKPNR